MGVIHIYCDTGGYLPQLRPYEQAGRVKIFQFRYDDNRNRKIKHGAVPSQPTWKELNYTWDEMKQIEEFRSLTWDSLAQASNRFEELKAIVGGSNVRDAKHLDSAYRSGCTVFLTSDKDDLWLKRDRIQEAVGISVLHFQDDWPVLEALLQNAG